VQVVGNCLAAGRR